MKLAVITHTPHWKEQKDHFAYGPYVREMKLWNKYVDEVLVVAPLAKNEKSEIHWKYSKEITHKEVSRLSFVCFRESIRSLFKLPWICYVLFRAMQKADHIHLRCPGNIGLLGCLVQILFPRKKKTAKYAGNWDPSSKQPLSYRVQKWILSNTQLTKNMQVLVYGEWSGMTKNIKPFFTASYPESHKESVNKRITTPINFVFVGSLVKGKQPEYAIELVNALINEGLEARLAIYGEGDLKNSLLQKASENITFHGNQSAEIVQEAYKKANFILLPSKSEGWPKVIAEGMFYGAIPLVTKVSCVPWMLGEESRGLLLTLDIQKDITSIKQLIADAKRYSQMSREAQNWSQNYTLDSFEMAIKEVLL
jgi:glycosyltransferase involved in cell wall biosynthesis